MSDPDPPSTVSKPLPPLRISSPDPPFRRSFPAPPESMSSPLPPTRLSLLLVPTVEAIATPCGQTHPASACLPSLTADYPMPKESAPSPTGENSHATRRNATTRPVNGAPYKSGYRQAVAPVVMAAAATYNRAAFPLPQ
ncbi:hypothetical protein EN962_00200 [Mesorhizobium sp. M7A.F.Ca.CA.001.09.2.1]|nr:hypothetical protein EN981_03940 [Mesorhizobium sp. M7A.F.Ca.CA.001.13.2.1]RUY68836.1 hypothetical protein EN965_12860 [Mesorhizobium sp. M7A.F.Ca.CA.001.05.1.1]RUY73003.1 hypothetical protein EN980_01405 [Mesorhizobium sp. M7A.F.Ca.CA.001.13.1.1]RUY81927.1 hypothetical protein EN962_00200 [Mesorhizobium sp. M7A.F.Ca.CA.001.09.2.1]RUZ08003.1 hypothetical protein EN955_09565 [Mesorhizobium sp. M7A.F.Ca.CA.001.04.2.1]RUZ26471.1 hypothetical protein EN961_00830 [Mesorhizobium sp. M7A.F.Ca.CA.0